MFVTKADKALQRMRSNPRDWRIDDLKHVADRYGVDYRQPGTSHVTFSYPGLVPVVVPAHRPIKPVYVKAFLQLIDQIEDR